MPQKRNSQEPPPAMTWAKASPVLVLCIIFDALRFMFNQFWFFGPVLIGIGTSAVIDGAVGKVAGVIAGGASVLGAPELQVFGIVMAMAVGLFGWLTIGLLLITTNTRIFKENAGNALWFIASLGISEIPFIGALPALTGTVLKMYGTQIKKEKRALKQYEQQQATERLQEQKQQAAELMQVRAAQLAQDEI
jgi:hypothetical protein